mgnify:FL=1
MFWKKQNEDFIEMEKRIENGSLAKYSADGNNTIRVRNSERADLEQIGKRNKSKSQKMALCQVYLNLQLRLFLVL